MNRLLCSRPIPGIARSVPGFYFNGGLLRRGTRPWNVATTCARRTTGTVGTDKSGFIDVGSQEGLLFFDNVFPLRSAAYDLRYLIMRWDNRSIESRIKGQCLPQNLLSAIPDFGFNIISIIPRHKDGGAFVKFLSSNPLQVETLVWKFLKEKRIKPWFSPMTRVKAYLVRGKPWLEDLYRFPSPKLKVEFVTGGGGGEVVSQEALYSYFRRYGKIVDIIPSARNEMPRFATIQFLMIRSATAAKNCLHGFVVPEMEGIAGKEGGVRLRILYEKVMKARWIRTWIMDHPRIVIPIVAAIIAAFTVAIFDPVRTWFIEAKVTGSLRFSEHAYWGWIKSHTIGMFPRVHPELEDLSALWEERADSIEQLKSWLLETAETFIVVQGPRGSGKRELVETALSDRKNMLVIDCEPISEAHGDPATIAAVAIQVGYRPVFSWLNTMSSLLDLAAQGTIGTSVGFSQTLEIQFNKILQNTGVALKRVALKNRKSTDKDAGMSDDEWLSAHPELRPVVIIDNFLHVESSTPIYERLADWAALLVSANIAHVIFLTNDASFSKVLARSLPDRVFHSIFLGDARLESAKRYVLTHIDGNLDGPSNEKALAELDESIVALGGRLTDLEFMARRIKTGETPSQAVHEIIDTSASEILKLYLLDNNSSLKKRKWTPSQAWLLVTLLASNEKLRYNEILLHDLFKSSGEDSLQALEQSELISIIISRGRPYAIKAGRPVFNPAFKRLLQDKVLKTKMDLESCKELIKTEAEAIEKVETELARLAELGASGRPAKERTEYLLGKMVEMQKRVDGYEVQIKVLKKVLKEEF